MEFGFTETQESLYRAAQNFGREVLATDAPMTREQWEACGEQGLLGLCVSDAHGGQGHDAVTTGRVLEGLGYGAQCTGRAFAMGAHLLAVCKPIEKFAERAEQFALLRELVSGRLTGAFATTEAGAGRTSPRSRRALARRGMSLSSAARRCLSPTHQTPTSSSSSRRRRRSAASLA